MAPLAPTDTKAGGGKSLESEVAPRRPGRPRDEAAKAVILTATTELLAEVGFGGVTVDAVAHRAGVGKATIYRRWASKESLVLDAIAASKAPVDLPDNGSLLDDLRALYGEFAAHVTQPDSRNLLAAIAAQAAVDDQVREQLTELLRRRREATRTVLQRAVERGSVPADVDTELVIDLLAGSIIYRSCFVGRPVGPRTLEAILTTVLRGVGADA